MLEGDKADRSRMRWQIKSVSTLKDTIREDMWHLYQAYYTETSRETFYEDLSAKHHVILLQDRHLGTLAGFSTAERYRNEVDGRPFAVVYSGDTIVDQAYWGQTSLQLGFLTYIIITKLLNPHIPVYWFLITKGYKTYLLMSRNFPEYWPRYNKPTPPWEQKVINTLAKKKFGDTYNSEFGLLCFDGECHERLKQDVAPIEDELVAKYPDIRFFVEMNPGHELGDELCCLALINPYLWVSYLTKLGRQKLDKWLKMVSGLLLDKP